MGYQKDEKDKKFYRAVGMVTMRCSGKTKSPYNGYYFRYCEEDEKSQTTIEKIATD